MKVARIDYLDVRIQVTDDESARPTADFAPARFTPEGYMLVEAFLARDGLLKYSDGRDSWWEYRPRTELERAAAGWARCPVTDEHPAAMVDSQTWAEVARGMHVGVPQLLPPDAAGVSYLSCPLLITDDALIAKIKSGKQPELSIGFTSEVVPTINGAAPDGTRADAIQTGLEPNHTASVVRGRAGPNCAPRASFDGAAVSGYDQPSGLINIPVHKDSNMTQNAANSANREDNIGAPVEMVEWVSPTGEVFSIPTAVAAHLPSPSDPLAPPAPAPAPPAPPVPAPPAPAAEDQGIPPQREEDANEEEPSRDAVYAQVRRRAKLERLAARVGVKDSELDAAEDNDAVARLVVAASMPEAAELAKNYRGDALQALVDAAALRPAPSSGGTGTGPTAARRAPIYTQRESKADAADPLDERLAAALPSLGY